MKQLKSIAHIHTEFKEKFGIPRQSGLIASKGQIVFEPPYRNSDAVRGLEKFSHIWILWDFSEIHKENNDDWSPTVRPPRLGGNKRVGVFATRSPFRPNSIGMSCVKLCMIENSKGFGPILHVEGADILDGTPIFDIKPYLPYADCKPEATGRLGGEDSFEVRNVALDCEIPTEMYGDVLNTIIEILRQDPRPSYQHDEDRVYGMRYGEFEIKFKYDATGARICDIIFAT